MNDGSNGKLPTNWAWSTIGGVVDDKVDQSGPSKIGEFTYVDISSIDNRAKQIVSPKILDRTNAPSRARQLLAPHDVLVSMTRPNLNAVAMLPDHLKNAIGSTGFDVLRTKGIEAGWLYYAVQSTDFVDAMCRVVQGALYPAVRPKDIRSYRLPIPPFNEQRRIVAKLDELLSDLDAGVAALERVKANLKRYRAAVLKAAVEGRLTEEWRAKNRPQETGEQLLQRILHERRRRWEADQLAAFAAAGKQPPKNWRSRYKEPVAPDTSNLPPVPDGWCWATLDQLLIYLRNGYFQSPSGADRGTPILRINAVRAMAVDLDEVRYLDRIEGDVTTFYVDDGDLLFTRYNGSIELLGVAGMVRGCMRPVLHPDKLIRVKLAAGRPLASFVEIAANVGASRAHMVGRARTTAGQTGISGQDIREMPIPLPPMSEQSEIVAEAWERLSQIDAAEIEIEHGLARAANLRQSILKRAFEGKLVAQDPADEPAALLLARIEQSRAAATAVRTSAKPHSDEFLRRAAIVSYTVKRLAPQPSFGRTQLEKTLHLAQSHLGIDLGLEFERYAAGPFDKSIYRLEGAAERSGWFTKKNRRRVGVTYHPGPKIDSMCQHAARLLGDKQADFDRLLDHVAGMNTDEAELFSTAYAAWNDLLIDGRNSDDGAIIKEIHGWHASKKKFTRTAILKRLEWMRRNKYVPNGGGHKTLPMIKRAAQQERRDK
ncbi:MAG TPA: restriction endonuclease subunit S [Pirellulales bacterium]